MAPNYHPLALPLSMAMNGLTQQQDMELMARNHLAVCATSLAMRDITSIGKFISKNGSNDEPKARARLTRVHRPRKSSATALPLLLDDHDGTTTEQRGHTSRRAEPTTSFEGHGEHPP